MWLKYNPGATPPDLAAAINSPVMSRPNTSALLNAIPSAVDPQSPIPPKSCPFLNTQQSWTRVLVLYMEKPSWCLVVKSKNLIPARCVAWTGEWWVGVLKCVHACPIHQVDPRLSIEAGRGPA
jgi:hypothetical protein